MTSHVISFRLDDSDPDEGAVLAWLNACEGRGQARRAIITRAVLYLAANARQQELLEGMIKDLNKLLASASMIAQTAPIQSAESQAKRERNPVSDSLIAAVQRNVKPSKRL